MWVRGEMYILSDKMAWLNRFGIWVQLELGEGGGCAAWGKQNDGGFRFISDSDSSQSQFDSASKILSWMER